MLPVTALLMVCHSVCLSGDGLWVLTTQKGSLDALERMARMFNYGKLVCSVNHFAYGTLPHDITSQLVAVECCCGLRVLFGV